jgi:glycosyltransferase involved in cell wall biosynthesis
MKILIISQYFWPEEFRVNDLAIDLLERGHKVSVITGNPNYPKGKFVKGYGFKYSTELYNGIKIYRVPILPRGNNSIMLFINYLSFVIFGSVFAFFHKKKYDKVFAVNYSPITAVIPAIMYCWKNKMELSIWVQDLWPESVIAASNIKSKSIQMILTKLVKFIYAKSDKIFVSNFGFIKSIKEKGINEEKIYFMPNWAEDIFESAKNEKVERSKLNLPNGFIVMFAGNIGEAQDFESIVKSIELTKSNSNIKWVFIGDGRKSIWLKEQIEVRSLGDNVSLLGRFPTEAMPSFFEQADAMLVSLKDEFIFSLTVPGKVQSYMAARKPILTMLNGAGSEIVKEADCGFIAHAGDYMRLAENIKKISLLSGKDMSDFGNNAYDYYISNFSKKNIINNFLKTL